MAHTEIHTDMLRFFRQLSEIRPAYSFFFYGTDLKYTEIIGFAASIYKSGPMNLIGRKGTDIVPSETAAELERLFENSVKGIPGETLLYYQNLLVPLTFLPLTSSNGNICGGVMITQNFTRIPRMENFLNTDIFKVNANKDEIVLAEVVREQQAQLAESEQKFKALFTESFQSVFLLSPDGTITDRNRGKLSKKEKNIKPEKLWELPDFSSPAETPTILKSMVKRAALGEEVRFEIDARAAKDKHHTYDFSLKPLLNADQQVYMIIAEGRDISEFRKAREELEKSKIQQVQNRQLEEFAWLTSHNLRSPAGNLSVLVNLIEKAETESEKQFITDKMRQAVSNLMSSIDILAETVKIRQESGKNRNPVYFDHVLDTVKDSLSGLILEAGAVIYSDFTRCEKIFYYDDYLTSILQNLMSNALKYRSPDRPLRIHISTKTEAGRTILTFSDNGRGINMNRHGDKIFGLYKTFHGNHDAQGVGLFLVRNQVEATGGKITVESRVNEGTVFHITF